MNEFNLLECIILTDYPDSVHISKLVSTLHIINPNLEILKRAPEKSIYEYIKANANHIGIIFDFTQNNNLSPDDVMIHFSLKESTTLALLNRDLIDKVFLHKLLKNGLYDFVFTPLDENEDLPRLNRWVENLELSKSFHYAKADHLYTENQFIGQCDAIIEIKNKLPFYSNTIANLLIVGETGTGKEVLASIIHLLSSRANQSFVPINCSAIPPELFESEIFGYKKGAFTGASINKKGIIEEANFGTLFLDEIDSLYPAAQSKLLRLLETGEFRRLGDSTLQHIDMRIVSASNKNLSLLVEKQKFRSDLYYRIKVLHILLPPLRDRGSDIVLLAEYFLNKYSKMYNKRINGFSPESISLIQSYKWPGNIRELENVIHQSVILSQQNCININHICLENLPVHIDKTIESYNIAKQNLVSQFEKKYIVELMSKYKGNVSRASVAADKDRRWLQRQLKKYNINRYDYVPH